MEKLRSLISWVLKRRGGIAAGLFIFIFLIFLVVDPILNGLEWRTWASPEFGWEIFGQTYWEWLDLLIVPLVLALGAYYLSRREQKIDREIAKEERENDRNLAKQKEEETALEVFIGRIGDLLVQGLKEAKPGDPRIDLARTYTLTILRRLNGERKSVVVRFLYEAGLLGYLQFFDEVPQLVQSIVSLARADLSHVNLDGADLTGIDLALTNLSKAKLRNAILVKANFIGAELVGVDFHGSALPSSELSAAYIVRTSMREAGLAMPSLWDPHSLIWIS